MSTLPVTSLVAGIFALLIVPLAFQVSLRRIKLKTTFGDADDETLRRRIRAHGNFIEYAPLAVVALGLIEYRGASASFVWWLAGAFVASRVIHALGMLYTSTPTIRAIAMVVNYFAFISAGIWLIRHFD